MRYIIIPTLIILYIWWGIVSINDLIKSKYPDLPSESSKIWVGLTSVIVIATFITLTAIFW